MSNNTDMINTDVNNTQLNLSTFRFNLSSDMTNQIISFADVHYMDNKQNFKTNFNNWFNIHKDTIVKNESDILTKNGYNNINIRDKIIRSIRYHIKKRSVTPNTNVSTTRVKLINTSVALLESIDCHINAIISSNNTPAWAYNDFCKKNSEVILREKNIMKANNDELHDDTIEFKIKKMYKNKFFQTVKYLKKIKESKQNENNDNNDNNENNEINV